MLVDMEIKVISEKESPFFKRREVRIEISHPTQSTPSKAEIIKEVAKKFSVTEDKVQIDYIFTKKGVSESEANIKILTVEHKEPKKISKEGEKIGKTQKSKGTRVL